MISINSRVMTAWRVLLNVIVSLPIISPANKDNHEEFPTFEEEKVESKIIPAFLLALSMAVMRDDCSDVAFSFIV